MRSLRTPQTSRPRAGTGRTDTPQRLGEEFILGVRLAELEVAAAICQPLLQEPSWLISRALWALTSWLLLWLPAATMQN